MKRIYAYCRVSTAEQNLESQVKAIQSAYPGKDGDGDDGYTLKVITEKASATSRDGRPRLEEVLQHIRKGDKLVVWKLDRLARNTKDLSQIVEELQQIGAHLEVLDQKIDTSTASGKAFLQMLGVFAEFETNLRKERQQAGIAIAKEKGVYKYSRRAPKSKPTTHKITALLSQGLKPAQIAREVGCSPQTVYNVKSQLKREAANSDQIDAFSV